MTAGLVAAGITRCAPGGDHATGPQGTTPAGATPVGDTQTSRITAPAAAGVLGANVNQDLDTLNLAELHAVSATWLQAFYLMQNADRGNVADQPGMQKLTTAVEQGYGTVLNLSFPYDNGVPTSGSGAMQVALRRLEKVLAVVMGKVDVLVIGNEPFFESSRQDRATPVINEFYETLAQHTVQYRQQHPEAGKTQIYMGALTSLESLPAAEVAQINRWLDFAKNTPAIAGTDCHPHVASLTDAQRYPSYILPRLRPDQKFLATEFSLVRLYAKHLKDPVSTTFADRYGIPPGTLVWQVGASATQRPFPQAEWNDFLTSSPWFENNKNFMSDTMAYFRDTGRCAMAGWGLFQDAGGAKNVGPDTLPWVFNTMFCPYTCQPGVDGLPGRNVTWAAEFRSLQR
ncbi:hypothetical protein [Kutzneria buriramensis]|nr:hypothetical protein [Kutzneria buriramensis]